MSICKFPGTRLTTPASLKRWPLFTRRLPQIEIRWGDYLTHESRMSANPPPLLQGLTAGSHWNLDTTCFKRSCLFPSVRPAEDPQRATRRIPTNYYVDCCTTHSLTFSKLRPPYFGFILAANISKINVKGDIAFSLFFFWLFTFALRGAGHEKDIITEAVDFTVNVQRSKSKLLLIFRLNETSWSLLYLMIKPWSWTSSRTSVW